MRSAEHVASRFFLAKKHVKSDPIPAIKAAGFAFEKDDEGNLVRIRLEQSEVPDDVVKVFRPIARFVREGSFIVLRVDGRPFEIVFRRKAVVKGYDGQAENIWDDVFRKADKKRTPLAQKLKLLRELTFVDVEAAPDTGGRYFQDHAWEMLVLLLAAEERYDELAETCARAPARVQAYSVAGNALYDQGKFEALIDLARRDPKRECLSLVLSACEKLARYDEALEAARALGERSSECWALYSLARYEEALAIAKEIGKHHHAAECLLALGKAEEARQTCARALESDPKNARLLIGAGRLDEALEASRGDHVEGLVWLAKGEPERAIEPLERAVKEEPTVEHYRFHLAQALVRVGKDRARAKKLARDATKGSPDIARRLRMEPGLRGG